MSKKRIGLIIVVMILTSCSITGCWNYRETNQLAIVAGVAVDRKEKDKVSITVEIADVKQQQGQVELRPVFMESEGYTFFSAIRKIIALQGRRLYWSHAKVIIVSEEIAKEGISHVFDFAARDAEIREDMWVLLSRAKSASEILKCKPSLETMQSFELDVSLRSQKAAARYPAVELFDFLDTIESKAQTVVIPTVKNVMSGGTLTTYISGSAIIKQDVLLGYLDEDESKSLLWIQDKLRSGLFVVMEAGKSHINVTLEILDSKTKVKPEIKNGKLTINVSAKIEANIGEIMGHENFINEKGRELLKQEAEKQIKSHLEKLIEKAQKEYKTDFLDFGSKVEKHMPKVWKTIEGQWEDYFTDMDINVEVNVMLRGSGIRMRPIVVGK